GQRGRVLRTPALVREERTLEMDARQVARGDEPRAAAHAREQRLAAARDQAAEERRRTTAVVVPRGGRRGGRVGRELTARAAVAVDVDHPRQEGARGPALGEAGGLPPLG